MNEVRQSKATQRRLERLERIAAECEGERVIIQPADEDMRRLLKHPTGVQSDP